MNWLDCFLFSNSFLLFLVCFWFPSPSSPQLSSLTSQFFCLQQFFVRHHQHHHLHLHHDHHSIKKLLKPSGGGKIKELKLKLYRIYDEVIIRRVRATIHLFLLFLGENSCSLMDFVYKNEKWIVKSFIWLIN